MISISFQLRSVYENFKRNEKEIGELFVFFDAGFEKDLMIRISENEISGVECLRP